MLLGSSNCSSAAIIEPPNPELKALLDNAANLYAIQMTDHCAEYLADRGIPLGVAREWRLGTVADPLPGHEMYRNRLVIPYLTPAGVVAMKFRCIDCAGSCEGHPKYLTFPGSGTHLFGVNVLHSNDTDSLVVDEGELDAIVSTSVAAVPAVGLPGASVAWHPVWSRLVKPWRVLAVADGDEAGRACAHRVASAVARGVPVPMPDGEDISSYVTRYGPGAYREYLGVDGVAAEAA